MNHYNERIKLTDSFVEKQKEIILVLETLVEKQNKKIEELGGQPDDFSPVYEQLQAIVEMKD